MEITVGDSSRAERVTRLAETWFVKSLAVELAEVIGELASARKERELVRGARHTDAEDRAYEDRRVLCLEARRDEIRQALAAAEVNVTRMAGPAEAPKAVTQCSHPAAAMVTGCDDVAYCGACVALAAAPVAPAVRGLA